MNVRLVFFDIKNIGKNFGVYHSKLSVTQIVVIGELVKDGKVVKRTTQKGQSKEISNSTLIVASEHLINKQQVSH